MRYLHAILLSPALLLFASSMMATADQLTTDWDPNVVQPPERYIKTITLPDGKAIDEVIVPGRPPESFKAPPIVLSRVTAQPGVCILPNVPWFHWSRGCSPTAAAMIMGYYDNTGFPNMYTGPANGGVCPMRNDTAWWPSDCPLSATWKGLDGREIKGHVDDYWVGNGSCNQDPFIGNWPEHAQGDCTADFMGTNQSLLGQCDGATAFYYYTDGKPLYDYVPSGSRRDGCHGMRLFVESRGYGVSQNFSQYILPYGSHTLGFSFQDYQSEINAGRPVLIQVTGHTMVGFGYDTVGNTVYIHDTWDWSDHQMTWGGTYSGLKHFAVTVIRPTGGIELDAISFSPDGGTYNSPQTVQITCPTEGAITHYTTNGADPTEQDPIVTGPIFIDRSQTLKARAWKTGYMPSAVKIGAYTLQVESPTFSRDGGTYESPRSVELTCPTPDAVIHYTIDGTDPTEEDPAVTGSVLVDHSLIAKAVAFRPGWLASDVTSRQFEIIRFSDLKKHADDVPVSIDEAIISAAWNDSFYLQAADGSSGIRVEMHGHGLTGGRASVKGRLRTNLDGERYIEASEAIPAGAGSATPVVMISRSLGGEDFLSGQFGQQGITDGVDLNNIGLLVTVCGRIIEVEEVAPPHTPTWFRIDDGSGRTVKCVAEEGSPAVSTSWRDRYAVVTGISSCELDDCIRVPKIRLKKSVSPVIY